MNPEDIALRNKLLIGLDRSYTHLVEEKQRENECLVFEDNGAIVEVAASVVAKTLEPYTVDLVFNFV
jgi:hypothetical protein